MVGTSKLVAMRREVVDIDEIVTYKSRIRDGMVMMFSGSYREGFRMKGSDNDSMFWFNTHPVIWDLSQTRSYNENRQFLILSVCSDSPPGFTLL
jgi:hypothetical protein